MNFGASGLSKSNPGGQINGWIWTNFKPKIHLKVNDMIERSKNEKSKRKLPEHIRKPYTKHNAQNKKHKNTQNTSTDTKNLPI